MQNSFWKIVGVLGVVAVGGMAVVQVQRGLDEKGGSKTDEQQLGAPDGAADTLGAQDLNALFGSSESEFAFDEPDSRSTDSGLAASANFGQAAGTSEASVERANLVQGQNPFASEDFENRQVGQPAVTAANYSDPSVVVSQAAYSPDGQTSQPPFGSDTGVSPFSDSDGPSDPAAFNASPANTAQQPMRIEGQRQPSATGSEKSPVFFSGSGGDEVSPALPGDAGLPPLPTARNSASDARTQGSFDSSNSAVPFSEDDSDEGTASPFGIDDPMELTPEPFTGEEDSVPAQIPGPFGDSGIDSEPPSTEPFADDIPGSGTVPPLTPVPDNLENAPTLRPSPPINFNDDPAPFGDDNPGIDTRGSIRLPAIRRDDSRSDFGGFGDETLPPATLSPQPETPQAPIDDSGSFRRGPNDASGFNPGNEPIPIPNNDPRGVTAVPQAAGTMRPFVRIEKSAPKTASVGIPLTYTISLKNEGDSTAHEVVVEDRVPKSLEIVGSYPVAHRTEDVLTWRFVTLQPGEAKTITIEAVPGGEGTLNSIATVQFRSEVTARTTITAPKLELTLKGPDVIKTGETAEFVYTATNVGSGEALNVFLRSVLPSGLKHPEGNDLEYEVGSLQPGESRTVTLTVAAADPGRFDNSATLTAAGGAGAQADRQLEVIGAQLTVQRHGPKRRYVGKPAMYENVVTNATPFDAVDATVVEVIPDGMEFVKAESGGQYNELERTVAWQLDHLAPKGSAKLVVYLRPVASGQHQSVVHVIERAGFRSQVEATTDISELHNVGMEITPLEGPVPVGEKFRFAITVDNRGTADATDVRLVVKLPSSVKVILAGNQELRARLIDGGVQFDAVPLIQSGEQKAFDLTLLAVTPVENDFVKALVSCSQIQKPLEMNESLTVYEDE